MTLRRVLLAAAIALGATAAQAEYAFDDAYWKQAQSAAAVHTAQAETTQGRYDQVDRYNP